MLRVLVIFILNKILRVVFYSFIDFAMSSLKTRHAPKVDVNSRSRRFLTGSKRFLTGSRKFLTRANSYVDSILEDMLEDGIFEEPIPDDFVLEFGMNLPILGWRTEISLRNWHLKGLNSVHRASNCIVMGCEERLRVVAHLGAGALAYQCENCVNFVPFSQNFKIHGNLDYFEMYLVFSVESRTGLDAALHEFRIEELKGLDVKFTGLGPLNICMNLFLKVLTTIFKEQFTKMLENKIESELSSKLPLYTFPPEGPFSPDKSQVDSIISDDLPSDSDCSINEK